MLVKNQTKKLSFQGIFNFSIFTTALFAFIFLGLFLGLNRIYAQPVKTQEADARLFASDLAKEFSKSSQENQNKLKAEIEKVRKYNEQLELKSKELYLKLEKQKEEIRDKKSLDAAFKSANAERILLKQQKQDLMNKISEILKDARLREARLYEAQAKECMKVKFFDLAITAYENSLKLNPANAQAHHTLSLLYNQVYEDKKKAIAHMKEYLKLSPQVKDKKEAQYIIDMLSEDMYIE